MKGQKHKQLSTKLYTEKTRIEQHSPTHSSGRAHVFREGKQFLFASGIRCVTLYKKK
jgi:hypothetical protein